MSFDLNLLFSNFLFISQKLHTEKIKKNIPYLWGLLLDIGCGKKPYRRFLKCKELRRYGTKDNIESKA